MIAISMIWLGWSTTVVCARLYTRFLLVRNPGPDDYLIILSWVSVLSLIAGAECDLGQSQSNMTDGIGTGLDLFHPHPCP